MKIEPHMSLLALQSELANHETFFVNVILLAELLNITIYNDTKDVPAKYWERLKVAACDESFKLPQGGLR